MLFIDIHTHHNSKGKGAASILNIFPDEAIPEHAFFSKSIHPWYIDNENIEKQLSWLQEDLKNPHYLAIGECGLDKKCAIDFHLQQEVFEKQLIIAELFTKPVIIHCVGAFQELITLKKKLKISVPLIIHGFSKGLQLAQDLVHHGFYLSFGKRILESEKLNEVISNIPQDSFFLETDNSNSVTIQEVYSYVSSILNNDINLLMIQNFNRIFNQNLSKDGSTII